ncbi:MAG: endonuclease/exonuclease/phosphatase family protein [Geobacter sp.]|nr:endonuclease/exonuclease/phosphatase family protein [Geobacter sp.]
MRIATFNLENLFSRPVSMNYPDNATGLPVLSDFHRLNTLLRQTDYTDKVKREIEALDDKYALTDHAADHVQIILREIRGQLWRRSESGTRTWLARGAGDFLGWGELVRETIDDRAIDNTALVLAEVAADIQVLVEVEDRVTLQRFHDDLLVPKLQERGREPFRHVLLMDGNDSRGIDVGLLSRLPVESMKTHVELRNTAGNPLFSRDCAQFVCTLPGRAPLVILANHFTSQGSDRYGKRRKEQATGVARLVDAALTITPHVIVAGDLNEAPEKGNLAALLGHPQLKDAMALDAYPEKSKFPGTYQSGAKAKKLDYLLLSKALQGKVRAVGVERRGYRSSKWKPFASVTNTREQASDHHCVWVDLDL